MKAQGSSILQIDLTNADDAVREALSGKRAGEKCRLEIDVLVSELDNEKMTGVVERVAPVAYDAGEGIGDSKSEGGGTPGEGTGPTEAPTPEAMASPAMLLKKGRKTGDRG